ncbi:MAG: Uma2 family endonuclease [Microscillaceae bacterium]|jgi:Uma2 family endonuclease|nr:Uma2 family endonuclease [Microscillaceae bacterium]
MQTTLEKIYTVEEYFELEKTAQERHEFVNGELIFMPGESKIANEININCTVALRQALKGKGFNIYVQDVRLIVKLNKIYRYPDLVVAPVSDTADTHAVTQPTLIIEVLSESTQNTDQNKKLQEYTALPSNQYYILISQTEYLVQVYRREGQNWLFNYYTQLTETIDLAFFPAKLSLSDIYENIDLKVSENK